jgi:hypothetical protein
MYNLSNPIHHPDGLLGVNVSLFVVTSVAYFLFDTRDQRFAIYIVGRERGMGTHVGYHDDVDEVHAGGV